MKTVVAFARSSIIVVILSLITTSSTWLSNANETSVLIAFIVPTGIVTLSICALTALVRSIVERKTSDNGTVNKCCDKIKGAFKKWGIWFVITVTTLIIVCGTIWFCQETSENASHYLAKCSIESENSNKDENQSLSEPELFILQEIILPTGETQIIKLPCDEKDIHSDGFVYYCLLHEKFE